MLEELKAAVCEANLELARLKLVTLTWGNTSGVDRQQGLMVIKPSGVPYEGMKPADMVVVGLEDGRPVEGALRPSSDTPTHLRLYRAFPNIGGITHTHSAHATMFCQAGRAIPCLGTTHADTFYGEVPLTRILTAKEVESDYEGNTGAVIVERFKGLDAAAVPAVLVAGHAPFAWGKTPLDSVHHSLILEEVARMALGTFQINPQAAPPPDYVIQKHYMRKHGPNATYGQGNRH
jgi:L-ribulose-5-phosphate 4-epimerase